MINEHALRSNRNGRKIIVGIAAESEELLSELNELVQSGLIAATIDQRFTLDQIVEAYTYVDTGRKRGSVVLQLVGVDRDA